MMIALFILLVVAMLITSFCLGGKMDELERRILNERYQQDDQMDDR